MKVKSVKVTFVAKWSVMKNCKISKELLIPTQRNIAARIVNSRRGR
jgi:hypothetical protein